MAVNRLKINMVANFAGHGWSALIQLAVIPLYIKFLGIEAFGLVGFYIVLSAAFKILDLGITATINRELARYSTSPGKIEEVRNFVRTLEVGYWVMGLIIGTIVLAASGFIANEWVNVDTLPVNTVQHAVVIMGIVIALQCPISLYQGGLMGLQQQVLLNGIRVGTATLNAVGAILVLWLISSSITAYFWWQIIVSTVHVLLSAFFLWRSLPKSQSIPGVELRLVRNVWRFAAGMTGIGLSATVLSYLDKIVLSNLLSLKVFGYYMLAGTVASGLYLFISPIFSALFPRLSALDAISDGVTLKQTYHLGAQLMAVLLLPVSAVLVLFAFDILLLWTGSAEIASNAHLIVSLLTVGTALNGLMSVPYALQVANGWTSLALRINIFLIILSAPAIIFMATHFGALGGASVWVVVNIIYALIAIPLMHRRLLKGEAWVWVKADILPALASALLVVGMGRWLVEAPMPPLTTLLSLVAVLVSGIVATALAAPGIRGWLLFKLAEMFAVNTPRS
jgi:O-antigen/teichoic acid export membrane protein